MRPLSELQANLQPPLRGVFVDIDDTLTRHGKLERAAFDALWRLHEAGIPVVPTTGRPAGWCDAIARQWPVDGVIGENGALAYWEADGALRRLTHPNARRDPARMAAIERAVLERVPQSRVAQDQFARLFDLAIDFAEDEPRLGLDAARAIASVFAEHGANAKISSIHVNGWFGSYTKLDMAKLYARERWGVDLERERAHFVFCGDSPNDEPMFEYFPSSVGVANVRTFTDALAHPPAYVTPSPHGAGFAELCAVVLLAQARAPVLADGE